MKTKIAFITLTMFTLFSCDAPRDRRALFSSSNNAVTGSSSNGNSGTSTPTPTPTSTTVANNFPTDVSSNCTFSADGTNNFMTTSNHVGAFSMCKSTANDNIVYFQIKNPPTDTANNSVQLCFIPMTTSNGNSIYIGNPMCGYFNNTNVKKITFTKYSAYSNATMNAVMFFKDANYYYSAFNGYTNTLTAFQACMNALYYGNTTYCNSFKATNQYVMTNF